VRSIGSADSDAISTSLVHVGPCRRGGRNFKGSRLSVRIVSLFKSLLLLPLGIDFFKVIS
jgi:hypothetical protein